MPDDPERDPFWEHASASDRAYWKAPWSWPRAIHGIGTSIVFWAAVVAIVYVAVRYG